MPHSLIEAATLDGAGQWNRFWRIKAPLMGPAFTFNIAFTLVGALGVFDVIMSTTRGGPGDATTVPNVALYQQYGQGFFGNSSALSLVVTGARGRRSDPARVLAAAKGGGAVSGTGTTKLRTAARLASLTIFGLFWIVLPCWFLLVNSFKTEGAASVLSLSWPKHWNFVNNYRTVIGQGFFTGLSNSLIVAVPTILAVLLLGSMAAWIYARSNRRSLKFAYYASILSILLPPRLIPTVYLLTQLHLNGSRLGYMLALAGTRLGIVIFMTTGFISSIPQDIEQAAHIDGASRVQVHRHIVLPMIRPVLFVGAVKCRAVIRRPPRRGGCGKE